MSTVENSSENVGIKTESSELDQGRSAEESLPASPSAVKTKVDVLLKPAGDAPIMKKKKWAVDRNKPMAYISDFIRRFIKMQPADSLFLYVNQSFAPALDMEVGCVYDCFGSDGKLVLHYCKTQAWG